MPSTVTRTAAAVLLLLAAGCTAHSPQARGPVTGQPNRTVAVSTAPATTSARTPGSLSATASPSVTSAAPVAVLAHTTAAARRTRQIVLRPVTGTGQVAPGYTIVVLSADHQLDCGGSTGSHAGRSPVAVDAGPVACGPSSEYALACWNGPSATTALCYQNPWQRQVVQIRTAGRLPAGRAPEQPSPLGLVLGDGTRCSLRGGGAWAGLDGHHDMFGSYSCQGQLAVWASSRSDGIDRSRALWSVQVAPMSGHGPLHPMTVRTAYFVGASRS